MSNENVKTLWKVSLIVMNLQRIVPMEGEFYSKLQGKMSCFCSLTTTGDVFSEKPLPAQTDRVSDLLVSIVRNPQFISWRPRHLPLELPGTENWAQRRWLLAFRSPGDQISDNSAPELLDVWFVNLKCGLFYAAENHISVMPPSSKSH